jgi:hypothetical protein
MGSIVMLSLRSYLSLCSLRSVLRQAQDDIIQEVTMLCHTEPVEALNDYKITK